jgi:hypothetical protein
MDLGEMELGDIYRINVAKDRHQWTTLRNVIGHSYSVKCRQVLEWLHD